MSVLGPLGSKLPTHPPLTGTFQREPPSSPRIPIAACPSAAVLLPMLENRGVVSRTFPSHFPFLQCFELSR